MEVVVVFDNDDKIIDVTDDETEVVETSDDYQMLGFLVQLVVDMLIVCLCRQWMVIIWVVVSDMQLQC